MGLSRKMLASYFVSLSLSLSYASDGTGVANEFRRALKDEVRGASAKKGEHAEKIRRVAEQLNEVRHAGNP